jgi:hypothetical protein
MAVAAGQQDLEQGPRLLAPAQGGQGIDIPEGADDECVLGDAEVVLFQVAKDEIAAAEPLLDRGDGAGKARVIGATKPSSWRRRRLASTASPSKQVTKVLCRGLHARAEITS